MIKHTLTVELFVVIKPDMTYVGTFDSHEAAIVGANDDNGGYVHNVREVYSYSKDRRDNPFPLYRNYTDDPTHAYYVYKIIHTINAD